MNQTSPSPSSTGFHWQSGELRAIDDCDITPSSLLAADSFLVTDDRALAVELHRERFERSARAAGYEQASDLAAFWQSALSAIPAAGNWFPRFELLAERGSLRLQFRLRTAPVLRQDVRLWTYDGPELRRKPSVKGPDLDAMIGLRTRAQQAGADEAVILDGGRVTDGATSALLWWRGEVLCAPPSSFARVDSVLARSILAIAGATGMSTRDEASEPEALGGCEVWAVNALHGIRVATLWVNGPELTVAPGRAERWRSRMDRLTQPLPRSGDVPR
jgi:branched-subunit amino acid aminotransferase/4-amino-4-deoxychorismate lyase